MNRTLLLALLVACTSSPVALDASVPGDGGADALTRPPRVPIDAGPPTVYAPCATDDDCGGVFCNLDYPRGICAPACGTSADCPENGGCFSGNCRPRCEPGANACRDDMFCDPSLTVCFPSCSTRADATAQACPTFGDACQASFCASRMTLRGAPIGGPCRVDRDCENLGCVPANTYGWPGGTCVQFMRSPGVDAWEGSGPLPSGGCLDQYAVVPLVGSEGDIAACVPRCAVDDDCRDGYRCDHHVLYDGPEHSDGACVPWICGDPFGLPCAPDRTCAAFDRTLHACFRSPP